MRASLAAVLGLVLCVAFSFAGTASAQPKRFETRVTIQFVDGDTFPYMPGAGDRFIGEVRSRKNACERNRKVTIQGLGASDRTNDLGIYEVRVDEVPPGDYRAVAKAKTIGSGKDRIICERGVSRRVTVE